MDNQNIVDWSEIKTYWSKYRPHVKARFSKLSEKQMDGIGGNREQLLGLLREEYGMSDERANEAINDLTLDLFPGASKVPSDLEDQLAASLDAQKTKSTKPSTQKKEKGHSQHKHP